MQCLSSLCCSETMLHCIILNSTPALSQYLSKITYNHQNTFFCSGTQVINCNLTIKIWWYVLYWSHVLTHSVWKLMNNSNYILPPQMYFLELTHFAEFPMTKKKKRSKMLRQSVKFCQFKAVLSVCWFLFLYILSQM